MRRKTYERKCKELAEYEDKCYRELKEYIEPYNEKLNEIKNNLGVGSVSTNKSSSSQVDVTIVIGKDF